MTDVARILVVNPFGIGDVLFSTPLVRSLRAAFPSAHLAYLCNGRTEAILQRNPSLDELFVYEKDEFVALWRRRRLAAARELWRLLARIRRRRFQLAIDLSLGERYSFLLAWLGVPRRIGFDFRSRGRFLTHRIRTSGYQGDHVVEHYARLLTAIGMHLRDPQLELVTTEEDREAVTRHLARHPVAPDRPIVGLVPAGGVSWGVQAQFRRWSQEGFVDVGRSLIRQHHTAIFVMGERSDGDVCGDIARAIGAGAVDLSGQTTLGQFAALIARCDLVISNDGGPVHIAASQGVPTVSIFGPVDPNVYGPYPRAAKHQVVYKADLHCRPCYHRFRLPPCPYERACLTTIEPADVLEACDRALAGRWVAAGATQ